VIHRTTLANSVAQSPIVAVVGEIEIRRATIADIPGLVASSAALFAEDAGTRDDTIDVEWPLKHGAQRFGETIHDPNRLVLVAIADGDVIGHLAGALVEPSPIRPIRVATLLSMYVSVATRGGGVGARLVDSFRSWARQQGAHRVAVDAYAANDGALRFYQRLGFAAVSVVLETTP